MSIYPPAVTGQDLYEASTTPKANLGTIAQFNTTDGVVTARYVQWGNNASIAAGFVAAYMLDIDVGAYVVDTAPLAGANAHGSPIAGVLCASMQGTATSNAGTGYGWCAFLGPVTNAQLAATLDSNVVSYVSVNSAAKLGLIASSSSATSAAGADHHIIGRVGATASNITRASNSGASGAYVVLFWK